MGWGKKTTGDKPQPIRQDLTPEIEEPVTGFDRDPFVSEKPNDAAKAQLEWHQLKSKKGWTDATLLILLYEFIQSRGLFADLVKFTRRR